MTAVKTAHESATQHTNNTDNSALRSHLWSHHELTTKDNVTQKVPDKCNEKDCPYNYKLSHFASFRRHILMDGVGRGRTPTHRISSQRTHCALFPFHIHFPHIAPRIGLGSVHRFLSIFSPSLFLQNTLSNHILRSEPIRGCGFMFCSVSIRGST